MLYYKAIDPATLEVLKSLTYFEDADGELDPVMLERMNWEETKGLITKHLEDYI